jgi:RNA polymerase-binding transcription factor DksA
MMDGMLLQTVEGLGNPPPIRTGGELWECLQGEKEEVAREILAEGPLCQTPANGLCETEASDEVLRQIEWQHRGQLETRLRDLNDAQDRLLDGAYGRCLDCNAEIDNRRLTADPAATLCINCQRTLDTEPNYCRHRRL